MIKLYSYITIFFKCWISSSTHHINNIKKYMSLLINKRYYTTKLNVHFMINNNTAKSVNQLLQGSVECTVM